MSFNDNQYDPLNVKPRTLSELKRDAEHAVFQRNHIKIRWERGSAGGRRSGKCVTCGKTVQINVKPAPNEIDIGGPAVALNCAEPERVPNTNRARLVKVFPNPPRKQRLADMSETEIRNYIRQLERRLARVQRAMCEAIDCIEPFAFEQPM